jgi:hypothetical protein
MIPVNFLCIPAGTGRKIIGKNPKIFRPEYCFHKITGTTRKPQFPDQIVRPWE